MVVGSIQGGKRNGAKVLRPILLKTQVGWGAGGFTFLPVKLSCQASCEHGNTRMVIVTCFWLNVYTN